MTNRRESDEAASADRLINYSDALVAVTFLGVSGIGIAIADPDIRCTIAEGASYVAVGNIFNGALFTALILLFRRWETALRAEDPPSERVVAYARWIHIGRLVILWTSCIAASFLAIEATDTDCGENAWRNGAAAEVAPAPQDDMVRSCPRRLALVSDEASRSLGA